ncbi:MAG: YqaA family protein [Methylohalobius crimeensis]
MFEGLYRRVMSYARHRYAGWYLFALSFTESAFSPVPPDIMLAPMTLARPGRAWRLATLTTFASVLGGVFGYAIGFFFFAVVAPWLQQWGYWEAYLTAQQWFGRWGFWAILLAGFSPIPYKIFTIAAGTLAMNPLLFLLASFIGRGGRFFLLAGLIAWGGERLELAIYRHINRIGWASVGLAALVLGGVYLSR